MVLLFQLHKRKHFSDVQALLKSLLLATLVAVSKSVANKTLSPEKILKRKDTNIDLQNCKIKFLTLLFVIPAICFQLLKSQLIDVISNCYK